LPANGLEQFSVLDSSQSSELLTRAVNLDLNRVTTMASKTLFPVETPAYSWSASEAGYSSSSNEVELSSETLSMSVEHLRQQLLEKNLEYSISSSVEETKIDLVRNFLSGHTDGSDIHTVAKLISLDPDALMILSKLSDF